MRRWILPVTAFFGILLCSQNARAQWQNGNLAIKTNGNVFQSGDQLKVEILALESITESFSAQVSYSYFETVEEKDENGTIQEKQVEQTRRREAGPVLESMARDQSLVLDDAFHFGDGSPAGRYTVQVRILQAYTRRPLATLRTCVFYQTVSKTPGECDLHLSSLKRVTHEMFLTFDGHFKEVGRYTVVLFRGGKLIKQLPTGGYLSGSREFNLASDALGGTAGQTFDILVHDHLHGLSSTLARVTIPSP
ncbi:MAG TPA: hypothetical protein VJ302_38670 [Blastocatellia bacterium]|nr:hypothetical protein [Blastocatellia bacterium]